MKFTEGFESLDEKRRCWNCLADTSTKLFKALINEAKNARFFESLYIKDSRKITDTEHMPRFIMLFWGNHPVGVSTLENNSKVVVEGGATLTLSQSVFGDVICIMYPFKSELHKREEEYFILSKPKHPNWYTEERINTFIKYFFSYCQASSFAGKPDIIDKYRIYKLIAMNKIKSKNLAKAVSSLIEATLKIIKTAGSTVA
jgi:hypothetical protein